MSLWDQPHHDWPPKLPRPTLHKGKTLINHLEHEEKKKIQAQRDFTLPNFRSGDVLKIQYYSSMTEKKVQEYSGIAYRKKDPKNIRFSTTINFNVDGINSSFTANLYSPLVQGIQIWKFGSNELRKKMNHIPALDKSTGRLLEPVIKGRGYKQRTDKGTTIFKKVPQKPSKKSKPTYVQFQEQYD
uniref:50S ribosomal protein L19, chloroplastic n=1 Tax=Strombidium rassoulzadegani TaxID=1082188 RepID=A0A7S3CJW1_9SPIT|mmetsp:Transcript_13234/g.22458  ORF Transcript_13234/g.22458 Transcript_13234/m.22458 type:complete len:185 (+) Transcript_13234:425-979(+)